MSTKEISKVERIVRHVVGLGFYLGMVIGASFLAFEVFHINDIWAIATLFILGYITGRLTRGIER